MVCGDACPVCAVKRSLDHALTDPLGEQFAEDRHVREEIGFRAGRPIYELLGSSSLIQEVLNTISSRKQGRSIPIPCRRMEIGWLSIFALSRVSG